MNKSLIRSIKTEADYQAALQRAGSLMSSIPNTPEADELEVLATLIELYEDKYFPIESPDPIAAILHKERLTPTNLDWNS
jgi:HTH-type transcriptional regulator / antitoxin HigA